jgi:nucleoside phosphorylase
MLSVLLVDDQQAKVDLVLERLRICGIDREMVKVANSVQGGRDELRASVFDLLLVDIALPLHPASTPDPRGGTLLLDEIFEGTSLHAPTHIVGITSYSDCADDFNTRYAQKLVLLLECHPAGNAWEERLGTYVASVIRSKTDANRPRFLTDVCVLTALRDPELSALKAVGEFQLQADEVLGGAWSYCRGELLTRSGSRLSLVASAALRMGPVNAAVHAARIIETFRPRIVVLSGICAGVSGRAALGDVLLMSPVWDWQSGKYLGGDVAIQPRSKPERGTQSRFLLDLHQLEVDPSVETQFALLVDDHSFWATTHRTILAAKPPAVPTGRVGPVASGSAVVASSTRLNEIRTEQNRKLLGLEMEGYGVYSAARVASPRPIYFGLKAVCDAGDSSKSDEYQHFAAAMSAQTVREFLFRSGEELLSRLEPGKR